MATVEWLGLVAVVVLVVMVLLSAATGVGGALVLAVRRGVCAASGLGCRGIEEPERPCVQRRSVTALGVSGTFHHATADYGGRYVTEDLSDGTVRVWYRDEAGAGAVAQGGRGVDLALGDERLTLGTGVEAGIRVFFEEGTAWEFPDRRSAREFVSSHALSGAVPEMLRDLGDPVGVVRVPLAGDVAAGMIERGHELLARVGVVSPPVTADPVLVRRRGGIEVEGGGWFPPGLPGVSHAGVEAALGGAAGITTDLRTGSSVVHLDLDLAGAFDASHRLSPEVRAFVEAVGSAGGSFELHLDPHRKPEALVVAADVGGALDWALPKPRVARASQGTGPDGTIRWEIGLDLRDRDNLGAVARMLAAGRAALVSPGGETGAALAGAVRDVVARLRDHGAGTRVLYRGPADRVYGIDAPIGAEWSHRSTSAVRAEWFGPGTGLRDWEGCLG